jgi:membrane protein implicated in regulation of membrane protease activity
VSAPATEPRGIRGSLRRVIRHAGSLSELQKELARAEMKRKAASLGGGVGLAIAAAVLLFFAVGLGIATAAAALAIVLDLWLALLILFAALLLLALILVLVGVRLIKKGTPQVPEQALEELRLTRQTLKGGHVG